MVLAHDIKEICRTDDVKIVQNISFNSMLLSQLTLEGLKSSGFFKPSPIQLHGIPLGKCGFDLILEAKSGTGKTAVFSIIALDKLNLENGLQALILAPTREIAAQICDVLKEIGSAYTGLIVEVVMGGIPYQEDVIKFKQRNVHIVVGSPGRMRHIIQDKNIDISTVRLLVLDEADKLMEHCFLEDINYIFSSLPKEKQVIMSSATYSEKSKKLIEAYLVKPQHVCPNSSNILLGIDQKLTFVRYNSNIVNQTKLRYAELIRIFTKIQFKQCLIFCNYQARVTEVYNMLVKDKWPAEQLYGQQEQVDRLDAIKTLKDFKCRILVSTDLAARGIDASNVDLVICFEPPFEWTTYLHRIGRAGRYGSYGIAITVLSQGQDVNNFRKMLNNFVPESFNIYDLWTNDKFSLSDTSLLKFACQDVKNEIVSSLTENKNNCNKSVSELLNDILSVDENTGSIAIESFESLNSSFANDDVNCKSIGTYKKIEIEDENLNNLNSLIRDTSKDTKDKSVFTEYDKNDNVVSKISSIKEKNTILPSNNKTFFPHKSKSNHLDSDLTKLEEKSNINILMPICPKENSNINNCISHESTNINFESPESKAIRKQKSGTDSKYIKNKTHEDSVSDHLDYSFEAMARAGLPTSFISKQDKALKYKNRNQTFKKNWSEPNQHQSKMLRDAKITSTEKNSTNNLIKLEKKHQYDHKYHGNDYKTVNEGDKKSMNSHILGKDEITPTKIKSTNNLCKVEKQHLYDDKYHGYDNETVNDKKGDKKSTYSRILVEDKINSTTKSKSTNNVSKAKQHRYDHNYHDYKAEIVDKKKKGKKSTNTCSEHYIQWYNQLKMRTQQIEYMIYVQEMSK